MAMAERAITVKGVAELYSVTPQVVYGWIRDGHIRPLRLPGGGSYRFRQSDLDEFETRCRGENSTDQTTASAEEEGAGMSTGQTSRLVALDPFQRGRVSARQRKDGGTNG
jgi:excisionase family DNA binding protein